MRRARAFLSGAALAAIVAVTSASAQGEAPTAPTLGGAVVPAAEPAAPAAASASYGSVEQRHAAAVAAYERQAFDEAEAIYRSLVVDGHADPTILLGLGNSAYRRGDFVEAAYAYEWASSLSPGDDDVAANLTLARAHLLSDQFPTTESAAAAKLREVVARIPTAWTAAAFAALWLLGWGVLALRQRGRLVGWSWVGVAAILLSLPAAAHVAMRVRLERGAQRGMLQDAQVEVRSGPGGDYASLFTLHAGTVVESREERSDWSRIALPQGPEGWVPSKALALFGRPDTLKPAR